jgi:hypothetical protein
VGELQWTGSHGVPCSAQPIIRDLGIGSEQQLDPHGLGPKCRPPEREGKSEHLLLEFGHAARVAGDVRQLQSVLAGKLRSKVVRQEGVQCVAA